MANFFTIAHDQQQGSRFFACIMTGALFDDTFSSQSSSRLASRGAANSAIISSAYGSYSPATMQGPSARSSGVPWHQKVPEQSLWQGQKTGALECIEAEEGLRSTQGNKPSAGVDCFANI